MVSTWSSLSMLLGSNYSRGRPRNLIKQHKNCNEQLFRPSKESTGTVATVRSSKGGLGLSSLGGWLNPFFSKLISRRETRSMLYVSGRINHLNDGHDIISETVNILQELPFAALADRCRFLAQYSPMSRRAAVSP